MEDDHMLYLDLEEGGGVPPLNLEKSSDLCEELMKRYGKSGAIQHRHLCASASSMRVVLKEEGLPLTPLSYFAATISAIDDTVASFSSSSSSNTKNYSSPTDSKATSSLTSFLSILLPLIPSQALPSSKAKDAVTVLVLLLKIPKVAQSPATIRSLIKSLGFLIKLCDSGDWEFAKSVFEMILELSIDKRPKVRKCAQVFVEEIYKSVQSTNVMNDASEFFESVFNKYLPFAIAIAWSKVEITKDSEPTEELMLMESVHMLSVLKLIMQYLSNDVVLKVMTQIHKILGSKFSLLTRHNFAILEAIFESSRAGEIIVPKMEIVIFALGNYVSPKENNPADTVLSACVLLKRCIDKLHADADKRTIWLINLHLVFEALASVVGSGISVSGEAAGILKELVNQHIDDDLKTSASDGTLPSNDDKLRSSPASKALESISDSIYTMQLTNSDGDLNENVLSVILRMFLKLGELSYFYLKDAVRKLAELLRVANGDTTRTKYQHLEECFGSAVIAMGPEKILTLLPVSFNEEELTSLNIWILPILKNYVVGSSLEYYMEHIIPLVEPLQQACKTVTKSRVRKKLQAAIRGFWDLLPAFCCYPTDTHKKVKALAKLLLVFIKEEDSMHENVCLALQHLVNQNRSIVKSTQGIEDSSKHSTTCSTNESTAESRSVPSHYTKKVATRNIKALASCSVDLLQALTDVFFDSPLEKRKYLKEAIGCLASITEIVEVKKIFILLLEKFQAKSGELENEGGNMKVDEQEAQRCVIMEFASALVLGASEDLVDIIFDYITPALQDDGIVQYSAYCTLSKIFEEHSWFYSSRFDEMMSHLLGLKLPDDIMGLRSRFACLHTLFVYLLKSDSEETHAKAFLILNEIILALKDSREDARKAAYDVLLKISCSLKSLSSPNLESPHAKLLNMISGYLSGASPSIMSGAVAALSLLIYNESDICASAPEVVPSVLALLKSKAKEVIKAVLGFVKVLVSSLQASDLQNLLADIVQGILPWSSVSRSHFREKVTIILEILIRKCGASAVEIDVPEKYMKYFKTVKEQRRGKNSSDKGESDDVVQNPKVSSTTGRHKRTHGELSVQGDETKSGISKATQNETLVKKRKFNTPDRNNSHKASGNGKHFFQKSDRSQSHSQKRPNNDQSGGYRKDKRDFNKRERPANNKKVGGKNATKFSRRSASNSRVNQHKKGSFRGGQGAE
ncbi:hypothetical protein MKX01_003542 [Papaver californicum]|nr:hypothetical protein MKX01_003542 [Papaver californicum]